MNGRANGDLTRNWGALVLRGVLATAFGVMTLLLPGITLAALVLLYGAYALVDGVLSMVLAVRGQGDRPWWVLVLKGVLGVAAAVVTALWPGITALTLVWVIASWAIVTGVLEVAAAIRLRRQIEGEWLLGLAGMASIVFGVTAAIWPAAGALALVWLIGSYGIVMGVILIALGFRLRRERHRLPGMIGQPA